MRAALEFLRREGLRPPKALISWDYLEMQRDLHARPEGYGGKGKKWVETVIWLLAYYQAHSMLDYGCGGGTLARVLREKNVAGLRIAEYDPAIQGKDGDPSFADLVVVTDVLEHIEPNRLVAVLEHIRILARKVALLSIALDPSNKTLSDGRNAHLIQEAPAWWEQQLATAGFVFEPIVPELPLPFAYESAHKRSKRLIVVVKPE